MYVVAVRGCTVAWNIVVSMHFISLPCFAAKVSALPYTYRHRISINSLWPYYRVRERAWLWWMSNNWQQQDVELRAELFLTSFILSGWNLSNITNYTAYQFQKADRFCLLLFPTHSQFTNSFYMCLSCLRLFFAFFSSSSFTSFQSSGCRVQIAHKHKKKFIHFHLYTVCCLQLQRRCRFVKLFTRVGWCRENIKQHLK